jgi:ATP-dependent protease ClpP protease subunit
VATPTNYSLARRQSIQTLSQSKKEAEMRPNRLLSLLKSNASKGVFKAEDNTIYLYDVIVSSDEEADWFGGVSAESFVSALKGMSGPVQLRINSPGGDVFGARVMANAIREYDGEVTAHVDGLAASAATFLTSVADDTIMGEGSMLMVHKAWSLAIGNADDFMATASVLEKMDGTIAQTYAEAAERRGKEPADFAKMMSDETWLTAQEAIDLGLADSVAAPKAKGKAKNQIKWDLSAFDHAPPIDTDEDDGVQEETEDPVIVKDLERRKRVAATLLKTAA